MRPLSTLFAVPLVVCVAVACSPKPADAPTTPTVSASASAAGGATPPPVGAGSQSTRILAGGYPEQTPHMWGPRYFDMRRTPTSWEVRVHDQIEFQGFGMDPKDKPPVTHKCTPWEPLPGRIADQVAHLADRPEYKCEEAKPECDAIAQWLRESAGVPGKTGGSGDAEVAHDPGLYFGRSIVTCT